MHFSLNRTLLMFRPNGPLSMGRWKELYCLYVWFRGETLIHRRHVICLKGLSCSSVETTLVTVTCTDHRAGKDCNVTTKCMCIARDLTNLTGFSSYFDHNIPCSGHLVMDTPPLPVLYVLRLTNYVMILDVYKKTLQS